MTSKRDLKAKLNIAREALGKIWHDKTDNYRLTARTALEKLQLYRDIKELYIPPESEKEDE